MLEPDRRRLDGPLTGGPTIMRLSGVELPGSIHSQGKGNSAQLRLLSMDERSVLKPFPQQQSLLPAVTFSNAVACPEGMEATMADESQTHPGQTIRKRCAFLGGLVMFQ